MNGAHARSALGMGLQPLLRTAALASIALYALYAMRHNQVVDLIREQQSVTVGIQV